MTGNDAKGVAAPALSGDYLLHVRDRLADVRLPSGDLATLEHGGLHLRIVHQRLLDLAEPRPVLGGGEHADGVYLPRAPILIKIPINNGISGEELPHNECDRLCRLAPGLVANLATDGQAHFARIELFAGALVPVDAIFFIYRLTAL